MENKNYIVAIDLGSSDVAVTAGSKGEDGKIIIEAVSVKESKGVVRGEVKNVEQAAQSIREAVSEIEDKLGIKVEEAYTGISGSHIRCAKHPYYVYVSGRDGEIFEEDVRKLNDSMLGVQAPEGHQLMHIIPQHYLVDDEEEVADPVGMFGQTLGSTFNLIIGDNIIISRLEKAFQKTGIRRKKLFINPLAMAEAVTFPDEKDLGVAVVDLGAGTTDLCIYQDGIVRYTGVIPLGADAINKDIRSYGIMERYVEELKVKYGCALSSLVDGEKLVKVPGRTPHDHKEISFKNLASIIEARMFDIADYINEEIKAAGYEGKLSAGLILTGGGSMLKEVKTLMEQKTGLDVRIASPDILVSDESKDEAADTRLAAAIGIIHMGMTEGGEPTRTVRVTKTAPAPDMNPWDKVPSRENEGEEEIFNPVRRPAKDKNAGRSGMAANDRGHNNDMDSDGFDGDDGNDPFEEDKSRKKGGFMRKIKEKFNKTFDFNALDDDNII